MTGEIGQLALCLALALACLQAGTGLFGQMRLAQSAAIGNFVFIALAFGALTYAFVVSDFSVMAVASYSHTITPLLYKITGVWGNHEGSMLLWVLVLATYSMAMAFAVRGGEKMTAAALGVQGLLAVAVLLFILFTSDPFARLDPPPFEGATFNPLLQDLGLAVHPPVLYFGYVGLSASFAYAAAALITGDLEVNWARAARPFMLAAWTALTCGIALGSWWAYYTLGWGGFWFWDPVENASLMPWLVATALLHSALATERNGAFRIWTLLLSIAAFSLSLIGTFLVRSGVITSVHAFANDPARGQFILVLIVLAIGGALCLFAWRAPKLSSGAQFEPVSRETALLLNNVLLVFLVAVVFVGTLYPLLLEAVNGNKISVGPPYFALLFIPVFLVLAALVPFGPRLPWRKGDAKIALTPLLPALGVGGVVAVIALAMASPRYLSGAIAFAIAGWLIAASAVDLIRRGNIRLIPASAFAAAIAHAGLGVSMMGVAGTTLWRSEALEVLAPGESMTVGPYQLRLDRVVRADKDNYQAAQAQITVLSGGAPIATMYPEKRIYPVEGADTAKTAIRTTIVSDLYLALGDLRDNGKRWTVRAYVNPLAPLIWLGGAVMALGGLTSLFGRLRRRVPVAATAPVPAE